SELQTSVALGDPKTDITVFLDCIISVSVDRIKRRGLQSEIEGYSIEYLTDLHHTYFRTLQQIQHPLLRLTWSDDIQLEAKKIPEPMLILILQEIHTLFTQ